MLTNQFFFLRCSLQSAELLLLLLCTLGIVYGCLEIHLDFIKVVYFYLIYLYKGLQRKYCWGGGVNGSVKWPYRASDPAKAVLPDLCKPSRPALPLTLLVYGGERGAQATGRGSPPPFLFV
jgi:hypothetical protein